MNTFLRVMTCCLVLGPAVVGLQGCGGDGAGPATTPAGPSSDASGDENGSGTQEGGSLPCTGRHHLLHEVPAVDTFSQMRLNPFCDVLGDAGIHVVGERLADFAARDTAVVELLGLPHRMHRVPADGQGHEQHARCPRPLPHLLLSVPAAKAASQSGQSSGRALFPVELCIPVSLYVLLSIHGWCTGLSDAEMIANKLNSILPIESVSAD